MAFFLLMMLSLGAAMLEKLSPDLVLLPGWQGTFYATFVVSLLVLAGSWIGLEQRCIVRNRDTCGRRRACDPSA